jgi:soluble lytic murein transglycosylase-like protein
VDPLAAARAEQAVAYWSSSAEEAKDFFVILGIESGFNPRIKNSSAGAKGLAQITDIGVAEVVAKGGETCKLTAPHNTPLGNLQHGLCYYRLAKAKYKDTQLAVVEYNGGNRAVDMLKSKFRLPEETSNYWAKFSYLRSTICK